MNRLAASVDRLGRRQLGLVTRAQLLDAGFASDALDYRVRVGDLARVRHGIYRAPGAPLSWHQYVLAAILGAPSGSVASHTTAARLHNLRGIDSDLVELITPRRARLDGVIVHARPGLNPRDVSRVGAIPVTDVARTLCDLSRGVPSGALARALDECLRSGQTTVRRLADAAGRVRGPAYRLAAVHDLIAQREAGPDVGDSPLESKVLRWLHEAGLPPPVTQHRVQLEGRRYRFDACYPDLRIAIETSGWHEHGKRSAFEADLTRKNLIEIDGWLFLEFGDRHSRAEVVRAVISARTSQALRQAQNEGRAVNGD